jgi:hypothetical protein
MDLERHFPSPKGCFGSFFNSPPRRHGMGFLKVLVSFLAFFTLSAALLVRVVHKGSDREQLVIFGEAMLKSAAASQGVHDEARMLELLRRYGGDAPAVRAKLGRSLPVVAAELTNLQPGQLWKHLAHKLVDPLYESSLYDFMKGFMSARNSGEPLSPELKKYSFRDIHDAMGKGLLVSAITAGILLVLRFLLSEGARRFLSVGIIITLATLPAVLLQTIMDLLLDRATGLVQGPQAQYMSIVKQELLVPLAGLVRTTYLPVFLFGAVVLGAGLVIHFTVKSNAGGNRL